jgi:hypothetical protein
VAFGGGSCELLILVIRLASFVYHANNLEGWMRIVRKVMRITWSLTSSLMLMSSWLLVVVVMSMSLPAHGATPADKEKSCRTFVQSFYSWYLKQDINNVAASDRVLRYKKANLSPALYRGLKEDAEAQAKAK